MVIYHHSGDVNDNVKLSIGKQDKVNYAVSEKENRVKVIQCQRG